jgi:hypothetical protein
LLRIFTSGGGYAELQRSFRPRFPLDGGLLLISENDGNQMAPILLFTISGLGGGPLGDGLLPNLIFVLRVKPAGENNKWPAPEPHKEND